MAISRGILTNLSCNAAILATPHTGVSFDHLLSSDFKSPTVKSGTGSIMDDPLIAFQAGDDAAFCPVSWKLDGPTLFHGRARWSSSELDPPRLVFSRPARPDRPFRRYAVLGFFALVTSPTCHAAVAAHIAGVRVR